MTILPANAFEKWMNLLYGSRVPHNVISTYKMIVRWNVKTLDAIPDCFVRDPKLGPSTFNTRRAILKRFVKYCIKQKYLKEDILEEIMSRANRSFNSKRDPYSDLEIDQILNAFYSNNYYRRYYYAFIRFLFLTGVRNGEAIGLKVSKINFAQSHIHIDKSYSRKPDGTYVLKGTKTPKSNRYIPLTDDLRELLLPICKRKNEWEFVFTTAQGNPINDHNFQRRIFKPVLKKLGIPERDLYACRHTFGTIGIEQKTDILSLAYLMGHTKPRTILDYYAKLRTKPTTLPQIVRTSYKDR